MIDVAALSDGRAMVVWNGAPYDSQGFGLRARIVDRAGNVGPGLSPNATTNRGGTYDAAGNLTAIMLGNVSYEYGFEAAGQLEFMRSNNHQATVYFYDAADERLLSWDCPGNSSSCGSGTALEHWTPRGLAGEVLRVFEGKSSDGLNWKEDFVYRGGQTLAAVRPTTTGFEERFDIQTDHLGSTRQITSSAGIEVERHTFYPFGEEATANQATDIPLKFTGHERDRNGGGKGMLDYMHARSCSPITGRFLSVDPVAGIGRSIHKPQAWNRYSEVANNPVKYVDPSGETARLAGCEKGGDPAICRGEIDLLNSTLGSAGANAIRITREGYVFVKRGAESTLVNSGVVGRGLAILIGSPDEFVLATNKGLAADSQGSRFFPNRELNRELGGGTIAIELGMFSSGTMVGGVEATPATALAHEFGHAVGQALGDFAKLVDDSIGVQLQLRGNLEGYSVGFENRYRAEIGAPRREYYNTPGDLHFFKEPRLFPGE